MDSEGERDPGDTRGAASREAARGRRRRRARPDGVLPLRVSRLFVTINTNKPEARLSIDDFRAYLEDVLFTRDALPPLLGLYNDEIEDIEITDPVIETGARRHLVHAHFNLGVTHRGKVVLQGIQQRWQNFIRMTAPWAHAGVYVNIVLLDTRAENYVLKDQ